MLEPRAAAVSCDVCAPELGFLFFTQPTGCSAGDLVMGHTSVPVSAQGAVDIVQDLWG